jgi:rubrerythrin
MGPSHTCTCGATLRYKQDLDKESGEVYPTWKCRQCGTPVPGTVAEQIRHQHPS